jgi:hypothetical protein
MILACLAARAGAADPARDVWDLIGSLAAALGRNDAVGFLDLCDPGMPSYQDLRVNVSALVAQADVESGIDPLRNEGDDRARELEIDWTMQMADRTGLNRATTRHATVKVRVAKSSSKWKVVSIEPVGFFAPPSA